MKIGYVRVSTILQNEARQIKLMNELGIEKIFIDKCSGKDTNRPEYKRMLEYIENFYNWNNELEDDKKQKLILHIESFSRLARSTQDLFNIIETLKQKNVELCSFKENINTSTANGKLMLTVLSGIAEFERDNLLERQREGIAIAKEKGKYTGRKRIQYPENWKQVYDKYKKRELTGTKAMEQLQLKRNTFYSLIKQHELEQGARD
jgi:DNA invertase Pin-like site-specific DNA recombinase